MTVTVNLPPRFYDDHVARDLPGGIVVKRTARRVRVELDRAAYDDLLDDARHYAGEAMVDYRQDGRGVIASARITVERLLEAPRP